MSSLLDFFNDIYTAISQAPALAAFWSIIGLSGWVLYLAASLSRELEEK